MKKKTKKLTVEVTGQKGGKTTLKKHGKAHFKAMAKKRWAKTKSKK